MKDIESMRKIRPHSPAATSLAPLASSDEEPRAAKSATFIGDVSLGDNDFSLPARPGRLFARPVARACGSTRTSDAQFLAAGLPYSVV
jgi:hypothetical protein